jgi:HTH-type transcriptional regulator/antitoxin HigA
MKTATRKRPIRDSYLRLVQAFPLRPIRNDAESEEATRILERLVVRDHLDSGEADYAQVLTTLVEQYDSANHPMPARSASPLEVLKHLAEAHGLSVAALGGIVGSKSAASMILSGQRSISKAQAKRLGAHFGIDAGVFI